jgi:outer membrane protein OmpA-like peptidoglycan-associated protein
VSGEGGARGAVMAGNVGATGGAGAQGVQGPTGAMGAQGPVGAIASWTAYRDFTFDEGRVDIRASDRATASEIATYLSQNPSLQVALDGTTDSRRQNLSDGRVGAVRTALNQAGVPNYKIQQGAFIDPQFAHDGRVEVLISTQ